MNQYSIIERLAFHNPWWKDGNVPSSFIPDFEREIVKKLLSCLENNRAILVKGPRRVGKTTAFYQLIDILLKKDVSPKDICYVSLDDPLLKIPLDRILNGYQQYRGKLLNKGKVYFFIDEVQFLKDWEFTVKLYFDRKYPIKFFISGSSVSLLTQKIDSLAGRTIEELLFPFSFREYLLFFAKELNIDKYLKKEEIFPCEFPTAILPFVSEIKTQFYNFLRIGGFPHIYTENEQQFPKLIKEDIIDKVVFRDLIELYKIREPSYLERLFYYLGKNTAQIINITTLSNFLGISRTIVERYISYLERAMLYFRMPKFSHSLKETLRSNPKGHLIDPSLSNFFGADKNQLFESAVSGFLFSKFQKDIYFWRDQFHEVDVVLSGKEIIPIEIKNSQELEIPKSLIYFMEKYKLERGIVVYDGEFRKNKFSNKIIVFCPAWYFFIWI